MEVFRKYGKSPFRVVLVHGGPGAIGEMKPVALKLAEYFGVIESVNRAMSVDGQIRELQQCVESCGEVKPVIAGFSWGAWLSLLYAARFPGQIGKLVLMGCGPLEDQHAKNIYETRLNRLGVRQRSEFATLLSGIEKNLFTDRREAFLKLSSLVSLSDSYDAETEDTNDTEIDPDVYISVWNEASELRKKGILLQQLSRITCPIIAIHGDYDPHPAEGIHIPLRNSGCNYSFELLKQCGHKPWIERKARDHFYRLLTEYIMHR